MEESQSSVNMTQNPFDVDSLDSLHLPQCSPSVFAIKQRATPASTKKTPKFRWSIDQMAILHPVEIEELPYHQEDSKELDEETESRIQAAIDTFFSQQQVVPSPWSEPKPLKRIPISPGPCSTSESDSKEVVAKPKTVNATCQTMLTLPMNFDLEALLGSEHFQYKDHDKSADYEVMSTSSLRRKLFSCDVTPPLSPVDDITPPISPAKGSAPSPIDSRRESMPFIISSPPISPIRAVEDVQLIETDGSIMKTPSSAQSQFSSSPIASSGTPLSRFSPGFSPSELPTEMESPCMSPIGRTGCTTPLSSTTSSESRKYTKSNCQGALLPDDSCQGISLPDDTSMISMSLAESPIRRTSSANASRTNFNISKSCPSSLYAMGQDHEESLANWSLHNHASQKLTSTLAEPMDSFGLSFEPKLCSSRLFISTTQESRGHTSGVVNSESLTTSEVKPDESVLGCDSLDLASDCRKGCVHQGVPPRLPFGPQNKMVGIEVMGASSDSGINTGSISLLEPTDMEGVEER